MPEMVIYFIVTNWCPGGLGWPPSHNLAGGRLSKVANGMDHRSLTQQAVLVSSYGGHGFSK